MGEGIYTNGKSKILFLIKFYIVFLILFFILNHFSKYLVGIVAYLSYLFIKVIFPSATLSGNLIYLPNNVIEVAEECTGSFLVAGFLSLITVFSKNIKEFMIGLFFVLLAFFVNIFRIVLICYLVNMHPNNPWLYHEIVSYTVILTLVPILVIAYLELLAKLRGDNAVYKGQYSKDKSRCIKKEIGR
ncbi:archaeosortase family protein ArtE [Methanocaldococcus fervens]|uniref:Exosortase EpsH-related protein n=1 Tax=Methanocaldococcus fervens (strain DSM 4213 / JCM 15782 / AG86) TaxID=573064 RepID=C7P922_METFA|nr:archaeosortase family protein ArtE [Methanocaldococcus fervens]ACV25054.1 hypothetical protein Mefer_1245 [Methanocaldococcus fervens AG86]